MCCILQTTKQNKKNGINQTYRFHNVAGVTTPANTPPYFPLQYLVDGVSNFSTNYSILGQNLAEESYHFSKINKSIDIGIPAVSKRMIGGFGASDQFYVLKYHPIWSTDNTTSTYENFTATLLTTWGVDSLLKQSLQPLILTDVEIFVSEGIIHVFFLLF